MVRTHCLFKKKENEGNCQIIVCITIGSYQIESIFIIFYERYENEEISKINDVVDCLDPPNISMLLDFFIFDITVRN